MKIVGLGADRRSVIEQICYLVGNVNEFKVTQFKSLVQSYESEDPTLFQVLSESVSNANRNYTEFLNAKIRGVSPKYSCLLSKVEPIDHASALDKAMAALRETMHDEREYRRQFLTPQISQVAESMDRDLRKIQAQEIRRQALEARAKSPSRIRSWMSF